MVKPIERELRLTRDAEVITGHDVKVLERLSIVGVPPYKTQAFIYKQDSINKCPIGRALDFKVAEEAVDAEQVNYFIGDVVIISGVSRSSDLGPKGKNSHTANQPRIWIVIEHGMLHRHCSRI